MNRILLISTSRERVPQPTVPLGAAWVAESLHLAGFQVRLLDLCFEKDPLYAVAAALADYKPDGIGLSVRNIDNCDFLGPKSFLPDLKLVVEVIKQCSDAAILLGGAGVSLMPLQVLEYLDLDFAVVGEGERAARLFFQGGPEQARAIPGVVCRKAARSQDEAPAPHFSNGFVRPRVRRWVDTRSYLRHEPVLPIQGKRGCANRCLYCTYQKVEGAGWRLREPAAVVDEIIDAMRHTGAREFEFVDSVFNEPEGYLEALLEEILRREVRAKFSASSVSPGALTQAQVRLMERAGMRSLVVTPESASGVVLDNLRKGFGEREVHRAAELLSASGIRALWCFLLGGPQEDEVTLAQTVSFLNKGMHAKDSAFITTGIRIYPRTGLHELALREGSLAAGDDLLMPRFYFSSRIAPQRARELLHTGVSDISRCIFTSDTRAPALGTLRRWGALMGLPTPFWRYAPHVKRMLRKKKS